MIPDALRRLDEGAGDGRLEALCQRLGVVLVTVLESAVSDPEAADDLDVAALFGEREGLAPLHLVNALVDLTGLADQP